VIPSPSPVTGMIPHDAPRRLCDKAKIDATSLAGGGLEKMFNDLQSYGTTAVSSGVSFGISHIPIVGPMLAKAFELASAKGITKVYEELRANAKSREERISYSLFLLERSVAADMRQSYNTLHYYDGKAGVGEVTCKNCQDAFREARATYLAQDCVEDLQKGCDLLEELVKDLKAEISILKGRADQRVSALPGRIENFRDNHKKSTCIGTQACYWVGPPGIKKMPNVQSYITDDDL
jgi:hypothetical protein